MAVFECVNCSRRIDTEDLDARCTRCGSALMLVVSQPDSEIKRPANRSDIESLTPGVWRFRAFLPEIANEMHVVTLGEGATPLVRARRLGMELGFDDLWIKDESRNPTGSFIDRGSTILMSLAKERGVESISCTTTGNLGASLAAYCAKSGISLEVRIHPNIDRGKLYQMIAYGASVEILSKANKTRDSDSDVCGGDSLRITAANPFILEGEKTTGFEIIQDLDWRQPDAIVVPVGTGGHLTMIWRAIQQLNDANLLNQKKEQNSCKLVGVQLESSAPIVDSLLSKKERNKRRASERIGPEEPSLTELEESEPIFKNTAVKAIRSSGGCGVEVSSLEAIQATSLLSRCEGIFAEPASASVVASLKKMKEEDILSRTNRIVCVITGAGLKDTRTITRMARTRKHVFSREDPIIRPVEIGETKLKIMDALAKEPGFAYDIWKVLKIERKITTASIYQHLSELEGAAFIRRARIAQVKGRERVIYELTRKGREFLGLAKKMTKGEEKRGSSVLVD